MVSLGGDLMADTGLDELGEFFLGASGVIGEKGGITAQLEAG